MLDVSIDFGGSTIDVVLWREKKLWKILTLERYPHADNVEFTHFLGRMSLPNEDIHSLTVTGGKSRFIEEEIFWNQKKVQIQKVSEIEAIGRGGVRLVEIQDRRVLDGRYLVVSAGTGTCMVGVSQTNNQMITQHLGGTGVGGGTLLGLGQKLLHSASLEELMVLLEQGDREQVDLTVKDIVGSGIGLVPDNATASNLAKLSRSVDFNDHDLAAGLVNLVGQTIGTLAVFAARSWGTEEIIFGGKLTKFQPIMQRVQWVLDIYNKKMILPERADFISAIGAFL